MYTWGSSPQALRLANQIKRRANAKQKFEEHQRREMSRRFEATIVAAPASTSTTIQADNTAKDIPKSTNDSVPEIQISNADLETVKPVDEDNDIKSVAQDVITSGVAAIVPDAKTVSVDKSVDATEDVTDTNINVQATDDEVIGDVPALKTNVAADLEPTKAETRCADMPSSSNEINATCALLAEIDPCEHMSPHLVDTSEVAGQILQVSFIVVK